jgi:hypothetical protein
MIFLRPGGVPERLNGAVSKTVVGLSVHRGFESLPLRSGPTSWPSLVVRFLRSFIDWLDVFMLALIVAFGAYLAFVLLFDGGAAIEIALVVLLFAAIALRWTLTSSAADRLRGK